MTTIPQRFRGSAQALALVATALFVSGCATQQHVAVAPPPPVVDMTPPQPFGPPAPDPKVLAQKCAILSAVLSDMWTRDPEQLVAVLQKAQSETPDAPSLTFLLAIAHAETNGLILDISDAGAVGLAQATPVAFLTEHFQGKLFVTPEYVEGEKAYLLKKPLNDADHIASLVLEYGDEALPQARELLASANELRSVGVDDLNTMAAFSPTDFYNQIDAATQHNADTLAELGRLLDGGDRAALEKFRDRVRAEYRAMRNRQRAMWVEYMRDLIAERDRVIRDHFGDDVAALKRDHAYEVGEYLAENLDARFSPTLMAKFLASHLRTKRDQALALGASAAELEEMTSALYNGGEHNVRRMRAGLLTSLPETENYMRKVPRTKHRLDQAISAIDAPVIAQSTPESVRASQ